MSVESEFYGFEDVSKNLKVFEFHSVLKRKYNSEEGNSDSSPSPHHRKELKLLNSKRKKHSKETINKTLKTAIPVTIKSEVVIRKLEETETVNSGGVEYSLSLKDGKYKITEKRKYRHVESQAIDDKTPLDQVNPKLCDTSIETDFQPRTNCGVQTDVEMLKMFSDVSCQTLFPDAMSSSAMEFKRKITQLEQSLEQCRQEATNREKVLKKSESKVKNLERNLAKSQKRTEMCQRKIDVCDKCSGRCDETTSTSVQTPFNQWTSTPVQPRSSTPLSSLHIMQNMFRRNMTTTPMNSPMLPTSTNSTSRGEIVPYDLIPQTNQPSTSFGVQNMLQNVQATALVNSPQPTSITPNLSSGGEIAPYNFMPHQPLRISPMCTPSSQIMFSGVPQLIVGHNVGQYNFQQALTPNQSVTSQQKFSQQQHPHSLPMASVQNQQRQNQNKDCACVQCFQQRHQQLPSLPQNRSQPTNNSKREVQCDPSQKQQLLQQQLAQQQLIQRQKQAHRYQAHQQQAHQQQVHQQQVHQQQGHRQQLQVRQDLYQQQSHQQQLVQQQRIGTKRQAIQRLEQAVLDATKKCVPKKVSAKKYLPKKD